MKNVKPIVWGIAIIALGVIFGGNALGLFELNVFFDGWWTLFIIIPSDGFTEMKADNEGLVAALHNQSGSLRRGFGTFTR